MWDFSISHQYNFSVSQQERPDILAEDMDEGDLEKEGKDVIYINVLSAVLFVLLASAFLMLLYFYMSAWFMRVLVILFCIGGFEASYERSGVMFVVMCCLYCLPRFSKLIFCFRFWLIFLHEINILSDLRKHALIVLQGLQTCLVSLLYRYQMASTLVSVVSIQFGGSYFHVL